MQDIKSILQQHARASSTESPSRPQFLSGDTASSVARQFPDHFPAGAADRAAAAAPLFATASPASPSLFPAGVALTPGGPQDINADAATFLTPDRATGSDTNVQYGAMSETSEPSEPQHPKEFLSILEMVNNGEYCSVDYFSSRAFILYPQ